MLILASKTISVTEETILQNSRPSKEKNDLEP